MTRPRHPSPVVPASAADTSRQLLDAAVIEFARQGFKRTTVRDICTRADANVAAVNYHFGSKARLYAAALDHVRQQSNATNSVALADAGHDFYAHEPPGRRLYLYIRMVLEHYFDACGERSAYALLIGHEMMEPTGELDRLVDVSVDRSYGALRQMVKALLPKGTSDRHVRMSALSVIGQCALYVHAHPLIARLEPKVKLTGKTLDHLATHIHRFSMEGLGGKV